MSQYVAYELATGRITSHLMEIPDEYIQSYPLEAGLSLIMIVDASFAPNSNTTMVEDGNFVSRPKLFQDEYEIRADDVEMVGPISLPEGSVIGHDSESYFDIDSFSFSTAFVGEYVFELNNVFPYQPQTFRIKANAL